MKIPPSSYEITKGIEKQQLELLLQYDDTQFMEQLMRQESLLKNVSPGFIASVLDRIEALFQMKVLNEDVEPILKIILQLLDNSQISKMFYMVEHLLTIITHSDNLTHIKLAMQCFPKVYKEPGEREREREITIHTQQYQKYLAGFLPRIIYLQRIFYEHTNLLNPQRVNLTDYFTHEQTSQELVLQFTTPTILMDSYEKLQKNMKHGSVPAQAPEQQVLRIPNLFEIVQQNAQVNTYEFARQILQANNVLSRASESFCPLWEIVRFRLLFAKKLHEDPVSAAKLIVKLHLIQLELYLAIDCFCQNMADEQNFLDTIFQEKLDFRQLFDTYFNMFKLDLGGDFHQNIILVLQALMKMETFAEEDECFNCLKSHDEQILKMVQDVLALNNMEIEDQKFLILPASTARHVEFAVGLLNFCASETGMVILSRNNVIAGIVSASLKVLKSSQQNQIDQEIIKETIGLIGRLARKDEFQREYNLVDELLSLANNLMQTNYVDVLASQYIQSINELFRDEERRRAARANAPSIARKIADTSLMKNIKIIGAEITPLGYQTLILIGHLSNEVPMLVGRLIDTGVPTDLCNLIMNTPQHLLTSKLISAGLCFFYNVSLKEEGYDLFNKQAMGFLAQQLNNLAHATREQINVLSVGIVKYMSKIDKAQKEILILLKDSLQQFRQYVGQQKDIILDMSNKSEAISSYFRLTQHIQNFSQLMYKLIYQSPPSTMDEISKSGVFEIVLELLFIPQFEQKNDIIRMLKHLSHADEVNLPKMINEVFKDKLLKFEQLVKVPLEKMEQLPITSIETLYSTNSFFMQEDCKEQFDMIAHLSFIENILEIFKSTNQSPIQTLQPMIGVKCAALYRLVLQKFVKAQSQFLSEKSQNEDELKIKSLVGECLQSKSKLAGLLINLKVVIVQITKKMLAKEDQGTQFLKELICGLSVDIKMEQDATQNLFKVYYLKELCNISASQEQRRERGGPQPVHAEFLKQLVRGGFYREVKHSMFKFFERLSVVDEKDLLLNEVLAQTSIQFSKLCQVIYLPRVEIPLKKQALQDEAHGILFLHVDEVYQTLQMIGTFSIQLKDKSYLQIFQTLFSKASQLLVQNPLDLLTQTRGTGMRIFDSLMRQNIYMDSIDPEVDGEQVQQEEIDQIVANLQEMGYTRSQAQTALQNIEFPTMDMAIEWLNVHQEEMFQWTLQDTIQQTREMQEEKPIRLEEEPAEFFQKLTADEFKKKLSDKIESFGLLFLKQILYYEGFEDKVSDFLITLLNESYLQKKEQSKPQHSKEMVGLLILGMKCLLGQIFPLFNLKMKGPTQPNYIVVPENLLTKCQVLKKLNVLLQVLIRVHKIDIQQNKENYFVRFQLAQEIVRLSQEVMGCRDEDVLQIAQVTQSMLFAFLFQFLSSQEHQDFLKQHKPPQQKDEDLGIMKQKSSSTKRRTKSDQYVKESKESDIVYDILCLTIQLLKSPQSNSISSKIIVEILSRAFTLDYAYVKVFILDLKGMELVLNAPLKGNNLTILTRLATSILQDEGLLRAQIEARIKKAVFDLELLQMYGQQEADSAQKHDNKKHQQSTSYPMIYGQPYYGLPQKDQVFSIPATHPVILQLLKSKIHEDLTNSVMKELFDEVIVQDEEKKEKISSPEKKDTTPKRTQSPKKDSPNKEDQLKELIDSKIQLEQELQQEIKKNKEAVVVPPIMLQLKRDSLLNTFQTVPQLYSQKFHYEGEQDVQKKSKSQTRDLKKIIDTPYIGRFPMTNFHHNPESQVFLKLLLQQITKSFFAEFESLIPDTPFHFELLQVLHIILRRYPVLIPKIARFNCSNSLRMVQPNTIAHGLLKDHPDDKEMPKKVSFLSLLLRLLVPFSSQKLCPLVLELCLDSTILLNHNSQIVSFGTEVRRKVLGEIYNSLEEEIQRAKKQKQRQLLDSHQQSHKFVCYSLLLTYLCQIKPVARMVFKNQHDQTCSFNFPKLYIEAIKLIPIKGYYNFDKVCDFLMETMAILYNLGIYNLFQKPRAYLEGTVQAPLDTTQTIRKYLENAPGALQIEDINSQMVPNKSIIYKESKTIFKQWPLPPLNFQAESNAQEQNWRDEHDMDQFARIVRLRAGQRVVPGQQQQQDGQRGRRIHRIEIYDDLMNIPFVNVNGIIEEDSGDDEIALEDDLNTANQDQMSPSSSSGEENSSSPNQHSQEEDGTSWVTSESSQLHSSSQHRQVMEQVSEDWTDDEEDQNTDHNDDQEDGMDEEDNDDDDDDDEEEDEENDDEGQDVHDDMMEAEDNDEDDDEEDIYDQEDEGLEIEAEGANQSHIDVISSAPQQKNDLFKNDDSNLLKQLKALTRMQSVGTAIEFQLVLEDLIQVIKLNYDVDVDVESTTTTTNDDQKFWNHTVQFFKKIKAYEEDLDKPFLGWWVDLVQQNITQAIQEPIVRQIVEQDPLNDFHQHIMRAMNRGRDLVDVIGARGGPEQRQYQPQQSHLSSFFDQIQGQIQNPSQVIQEVFQRQQLLGLRGQQGQLRQRQVVPPQQAQQQQPQPTIQDIARQQQEATQVNQRNQETTAQMLQVDWSNLNLQAPQQQIPQQPIQEEPLAQQSIQLQQQQLLQSQQQLLQQQMIIQMEQSHQQLNQLNLTRQLDRREQELGQQLQQPPQQQQLPQQLSLPQPQQLQQLLLPELSPQRQEIRQQFPRSALILERMGRSFETLQTNGLDLMTFEELPEEFQVEILQGFDAPPQPQRQQQQTIDPAFLSQLPPELQFELMQPPPEPQLSGIDTITFIQTLTPDLREEVLLTLGNEILDQLPADLRAEAMEIRMRANQRAMHRLEEQQIHEQIRREVVHRDQGVARGRPQQQQPQVIQPINQKTLRDLKEHFLKDKHLLAKLGNLDDEFIEALLSFLYVESHSFVYFPINLLASLQSNPILESKILDALFYILKQQLQLQEQKTSIGLKDDQFPLSFIVQRYTILHDYRKTYENVSLKILYLFSKLPQNSIQYFFDSGAKKQLQSIQKLAASQNNFQQGIQLIPLLQLIHLLPQQTDSHMHLQLLVAALYNLTRKNLKVLAVRNDRTTEPLYQVKLDQSSIRCICQVLLSTGVQQKTIKQLSLIINHLCVDSQNLHLFIQEIRSVITDVTKGINEVFERTFLTLQTNSIHVTARQLEQEIKGERILINIFQFVRELFEMEQNRQSVKDIQKQEALNNTKKDGEQKIEVEQETDATLENIRKSFQELITDESLYRLWLNTTNILQVLGTISKDLSRVHFKVAPILESFFIIYQILNPQQDKKKSQAPQVKAPKTQMKISQMQNIQEEKQVSPQLQQVDKQTPDDMFNMICEKGKVVLNLMIKEKLSDPKLGAARWENNKKSILSEALGIIFIKQPKIVDFENKQKYFKQELKQLKAQIRHYAGSISLRIRRKDIFNDSYHHFSKKRTEELRGKLNIEFTGEEGVDAGGVTREWFLVLSREIFNPDYALFQSSLNGQMFQPSTKSAINFDHLKYFKFIGRVVGKALYDGYLLDSYFTRSFYKHILGQSITFHDIEDIDLHEYNSMKKILETDVTNWGLNWIYNVENFGIREERELVVGGKNMPVTQENKAEYVQTYCYQKMAKDIKEQTEAFLSGFYELIPQHLISIFEWKEMELMLCGLPDIDLEDLKENVEYHNYTHESKIIKWLWELLESYDKSKRASFLQFVTGTSKVPLGGFKDLKGMSGPQKLQIHKKPYYNFELPTSHTCFNQLDLPDYPTREVLKEKLELAILEGKEGFGFA